MLGFGSSLARSVAPYSIFDGVHGAVQRQNIVGLRRRGADNVTIGAVSAAIALLYQDDGTLQDRARSLLDAPDTPPSQVIEIAEFVLNRLGKRGLVRGKSRISDSGDVRDMTFSITPTSAASSAKGFQFQPLALPAGKPECREQLAGKAVGFLGG